MNQVSNMNTGMRVFFALLAVASARLLQQGPVLAPYGGNVNDSCGKDPRMITDGIYLPEKNPMDSQLEMIKNKRLCLENKAIAQKQIQQKVTSAIKEAIEEQKQPVAKKSCVYSLDNSSHDCFVKNVLNNLYTAPIWKVGFHDNVGVLYYNNKAILMVIHEVLYYDIEELEKRCFTFFPNASFVSEQNAFGHVLNASGKIETDRRRKTGACSPCSDFKNRRTQLADGNGQKCTNSCDLPSTMVDPFNFKSMETNKIKIRKPSTKNREQSSTTSLAIKAAG